MNDDCCGRYCCKHCKTCYPENKTSSVKEEMAKLLNAKVFVKKATYTHADRKAGRGIGTARGE